MAIRGKCPDGFVLLLLFSGLTGSHPAVQGGVVNTSLTISIREEGFVRSSFGKTSPPHEWFKCESSGFQMPLTVKWVPEASWVVKFAIAPSDSPTKVK